MNQDGRVVAFSIGLLALRLVIGVTFFAHGAQKLFGWFGGPGIAGFADVLSLHGVGFGMPVILAWVVSLIEFVGGILLFFGLFTRISAFLVGIVAAVSLGTVYWGGGFFPPDGIELPLIKLAIMVCLFLTGAGLYSLDVGFAWKPRKRDAAAPPPPPDEAGQGQE